MTDSLNLKDYSPHGLAIVAMNKLDAFLLKPQEGDPRRGPEILKRGDDAGEYEDPFLFGQVSINRNANERGDIAVTFYTETYERTDPLFGRLELAQEMVIWIGGKRLMDQWARHYLLELALVLEKTMGFVVTGFSLPHEVERTSKLQTECTSIYGYFPMNDGTVMEVHLDRNRYIPLVIEKPKHVVPPGLRQGMRHRRG